MIYDTKWYMFVQFICACTWIYTFIQLMWHVDINRELSFSDIVLNIALAEPNEAVSHAHTLESLQRKSFFSGIFIGYFFLKYLKPLTLAVFSSCGHTVALTSKQVNTVVWRAVGPQIIESFFSDVTELMLQIKRRRKQARTRIQHYNLTATANKEWGYVKRKRDSEIKGEVT